MYAAVIGLSILPVLNWSFSGSSFLMNDMPATTRYEEIFSLNARFPDTPGINQVCFQNEFTKRRKIVLDPAALLM